MSARSATRPAIDWNTVELVGDLEPIAEDSHREHALLTHHAYSDQRLARQAPGPRVYPDRRGRSDVKKVLSGASMKARGNGARLTHGQICKRLRPGFDVLVYGIGLLAAATAYGSDPARSVVLAAYVIGEVSERLTEADASSAA
jgi:hypothetical protein